MLIRYRLQDRLFGKPLVILQVGYEKEIGAYVGADGEITPPPNWGEGETYIKWRDATAEDLMNENTN